MAKGILFLNHAIMSAFRVYFDKKNTTLLLTYLKFFTNINYYLNAILTAVKTL